MYLEIPKKLRLLKNLHRRHLFLKIQFVATSETEASSVSTIYSFCIVFTHKRETTEGAEVALKLVPHSTLHH